VSKNRKEKEFAGAVIANKNEKKEVQKSRRG
jgi:hypothetical protein